MNKLTSAMVEHFNLKMESEGSCLRYLISTIDGDLCTSYKLTVVDKYINPEQYTIPQVTNEFEDMVRNFFKEKYNVDNLGFSNSVATIFAYNN